MNTNTRNATLRTIRRRTLALLLPGLFALPAAHAVELEAGDWKIDIGGFINAFYTYADCGGDPVGGTALASPGLGCGGADDRSTIGNGLLPNALVTKFSTTQGDYDLGGTLAIMAHTATSSAIAPNSGVDVRQVFFTVGNADIGSFKLGRDYGVFGSGAILTDMTLLGVGMPIQATQRGRVSLGHIGAGYTYLGNYGQLAWSKTAANGTGFTVAVVSPVDNGSTHDAGSGPQLQAQFSFAGDGYKVWAGAKAQKFESVDPDAVDDFTMRGFEVGASFTAGRFSALANVQKGSGLGILADGDQGDVDSTNWLAQGTFMATDKLKLGLNYGISKNDDNLGPDSLESNTNLTGAAYYTLTKSVTLAFELGTTRSKNHAGDEAKLNGVSFGGIVFF